MATTISAMEIRKQLGDLLSRILYTGECFIIERRGKPIAAIIGIEEYKAVLPILEDLEDVTRAEESLARYRENPEEFVDFDAYVAERLARGV